MDDKNNKSLSDRLDNFMEWTKEIDKRDREFDDRLNRLLEMANRIEKSIDDIKIKRTNN